MKSCGIILTYIDWKKVKKWFFNIPLFIYQLILMVFGTVYGKIKWPKAPISIKIMSGFVILVCLLAIPQAVSAWAYWIMLIWIVYFLIGLASYQGIHWGKIWRAAQVSHVRLCLRRGEDQTAMVDVKWAGNRTARVESALEAWNYINFGYPKAEIKPWRMDQCKGRFEYRRPTFDPSPEFIEAMIEYAEKQVGKGYDDLQLISNGLHLIAWIVWPWCWGKELKIIKAFNRKGGREHCISGVTACLRWGEYSVYYAIPQREPMRINKSRFFPGYSTATTSPCLVPLSKNWRVKR